MTVGPDIKEVLQDVGVKIKIYAPTRTYRGEYIKYAPNSQVTKPFIREFFLDGQAAYDTDMAAGHIVEILETGVKYIVMNKTPAMLENSVYRYDVVLYKCNVTIDVERPVEIRSDYLTRTTWQKIKSAQPALLTSPLFGVTMETDREIGLLRIDRGELYVPTSYGVQRLDRIRITGTREYYRVEAIQQRRYEDVDVVDVGEDQRPGTTTTTTTTSSSTTTTTSSSSTTTTTSTSTTTTTTA